MDENLINTVLENRRANMQKVSEWVAPDVDGAPLLCVPNIPKPLHQLAPRLIEGKDTWDTMRKTCYREAHFSCQACGKYLGPTKCQAHEVYSIDYERQFSKFERCVCLCPSCHMVFIHSGRAITMYKKGEFSMGRLVVAIRKGFKLIHQYNQTASETTKLRVCGTILGWTKEPDVAEWLIPLIDEYNIQFFSPIHAYEDKAHWDKWRLVYNSKLYSPVYANGKAWAENVGKIDTTYSNEQGGTK